MSLTLLDGGMGQELVARNRAANGAAPTPLWATQVLLDAPEIVRAVHDDFFAAGAEIATVNSYAILRDRLEPRGLSGRFAELHEAACQIAIAARDAHGSGRVAGSAGPLGWSYAPHLVPPSAEAAPLYAEIAAIQAPFVDLTIIETMASVDQARGALMGYSGAPAPVWLAVTASDADGTRLRSGEPIVDILPLVAEFGAAALLVNCSMPEAVTQALTALAEAAPPVPLGAYANGFTGISAGFVDPNATVAQLQARADLGPAAYAEHAAEWVRLGATIVGGCCEVGPSHIAALRRRFKD